jgi:hypothetical protein
MPIPPPTVNKLKSYKFLKRLGIHQYTVHDLLLQISLLILFDSCTPFPPHNCRGEGQSKEPASRNRNKIIILDETNKLLYCTYI